jgi:hypothetical protein
VVSGGVKRHITRTAAKGAVAAAIAL